MMMARGIFVSLITILICTLTFLYGCGKSDPPSSVKAITAYSLNGVAGTINETKKTIAITMPSGTNVTSLVATFTKTGALVIVDEILQESGVTVNNFTSPVAYTVAAADGTTVTYTVIVHVWYYPASLADNISPVGQYDAESVQTAMDNNGNAIIVWQQYDGTNWQIFKSEYRNGVWTHPASLTDKISPDGDASNPKVAMDDHGNAIIIWSEYYGADYQMFKSEYRNGVWTHPISLADNFSPDSVPDSPWTLACQVAMDNNGNAIIVWAQLDDVKGKIFKSEYRNGTWTHPTSRTDHISLDGQWAGNPQVAMDNNGNAIIAWYQIDGGGTNGQIFKSEYRNGAWHHPANIADNISPDGQNTYHYSQVAKDESGKHRRQHQPRWAGYFSRCFLSLCGNG
jgi:hypothetical protein